MSSNITPSFLVINEDNVNDRLWRASDTMEVEERTIRDIRRYIDKYDRWKPIV